MVWGLVLKYRDGFSLQGYTKQQLIIKIEKFFQLEYLLDIENIKTKINIKRKNKPRKYYKYHREEL